eukprot:457237_1
MATSFGHKLLKLLPRRNLRIFGAFVPSVFATAFLSTKDLDQENSNNIGWKKFQTHADTTKRMELLKQKRDCKSKQTITSPTELETYLDALQQDWFINISDDGKYHLIREFNVDTYGEVMDISSAVMECSDSFNYHPDMKVTHKQVIVDIFSFKLNGLREIDFIFAAKIDQVIDKLSKEYIDNELETYMDDIVDWSTRELAEQWFEKFSETFRNTVKSGDTFDELLKYYANDVYDCNPKRCYDNKADLLRDLNNGFKKLKTFDPYFDILIWSKKQCLVKNTYVRTGINDKLLAFRGTILIKLNDEGKISHWIYTADQKMLDEVQAFREELSRY